MPTTSPDGFVYPNSSDNTQLWLHFQNLAESVQSKFNNMVTWSSWTPTWDTTNGGGFTSVGGSGVSEGTYMQIGSLVHAQFRVELASGFTTDTGTFIVMLPVTAYTFGTRNNGVIGYWQARDNSVPYHWGGPMAMWDNTGTRGHFGGSWDGSAPRSRIDSNDPIVWAAGDVLSGNLTYRAA